MIKPMFADWPSVGLRPGRRYNVRSAGSERVEQAFMGKRGMELA